MKAAFYDRYGGPEVVSLRELPRPTPGAGEVLIKVASTTVAAGDWRLRRADPFLARLYNGLLRPKKVQVLGFEVAGTVEAVSTGVTRYAVGDEVYGFTGFGFGAHAEYCVMKETTTRPDWEGLLAHKPAALSMAQAAAVPVGALTAQAFLRAAGVKPGQSVLVFGASGSVGTAAVQLAKHLGATVTGVCSTSNVELVRGLGAHDVIDYTTATPGADGRRWDVVFDAVGKLSSSAARGLRGVGGVVVSVKRTAKLAPDDLEAITRLLEEGALRPVIDRSFPLDAIVEAHAYVETGHKRGNVVVSVDAATAEGLAPN